MRCEHCAKGSYTQMNDGYWLCESCSVRKLDLMLRLYDPPQDRDFVTQKEVDGAIADLQKLAQDLEDT